MRIIDISDDTYSSVHVCEVLEIINKEISDNGKAEISLFGIDGFSCTYMNAIFLYLVDSYGVAFFRKNIKIVQVQKKVATRLREYISSYVSHFKLENT